MDTDEKPIVLLVQNYTGLPEVLSMMIEVFMKKTPLELLHQSNKLIPLDWAHVIPGPNFSFNYQDKEILKVFDQACVSMMSVGRIQFLTHLLEQWDPPTEDTSLGILDFNPKWIKDMRSQPDRESSLLLAKLLTRMYVKFRFPEHDAGFEHIFRPVTRDDHHLSEVFKNAATTLRNTLANNNKTAIFQVVRYVYGARF